MLTIKVKMKKILLSCIFIVVLSACATKPSRKSTVSTSNVTHEVETKAENQRQNKVTIESNESFGPPAPPPSTIAAGVAAAKEAERIRSESASEDYTLVLGPGLARTLSYIGVLKELDAQDKKFRAVVGIEMGALMAAIYSQSNANKLEWEMHKFNSENFIDSGFLGFGKKSNQGKAFEQYLSNLFGKALAEQTKKHLWIATAYADPNLNGEAINLYDKGALKDLVRAANSFPGLLKQYSFDNSAKLSLAFEDPFPIEKIKDKTGGKVLCVNAIGKGNDFFPQNQNDEFLASIYRTMASLAKKGLSECDDIINVDVSSISPLQFDAKAELIARGKTAAQKWLNK